MKVRVLHEYAVAVNGLSAWGVTKMLEKHLEPHKNRPFYGFREEGQDYIIWWSTFEEVPR